LYGAEEIPHILPLATTFVQGSLYADKPALTFARNANNVVTIIVKLWGRDVQVQTDSGWESRPITVDATLSVPVRVVIQNRQLLLGLDGAPAQLDAIAIAVVPGAPPFSVDLQAATNSPLVRQVL